MKKLYFIVFAGLMATSLLGKEITPQILKDALLRNAIKDQLSAGYVLKSVRVTQDSGNLCGLGLRFRGIKDTLLKCLVPFLGVKSHTVSFVISDGEKDYSSHLSVYIESGRDWYTRGAGRSTDIYTHLSPLNCTYSESGVGKEDEEVMRDLASGQVYDLPFEFCSLRRTFSYYEMIRPGFWD